LNAKPKLKADVDAATWWLSTFGAPIIWGTWGRADEQLLKSIMINPYHVLSKHLSQVNLRP